MSNLRSVVALLGAFGVQGGVQIRGTFRLQQKGGNDGSSVMRYLDAYDGGEDFKVVTRGLQENPSQWWYFESVGDLEDQIYTIQQVGANDGSSLGRYLDAYEDSFNDFKACTRNNQHNPSEQWHLTATAENTYRISQVGHNDGSLWSSPRYLDAYEGAAGPAHNWLGVTRPMQNNPSQEWVLTPLLPGEEATAQQLVDRFGVQNDVEIRGTYRLQQKGGNDGSSVMRYLDAYEGAGGPAEDFKVVTRGLQENPSQWWYFKSVGELEDQIYTIQQVGGNDGSSLGRYLDAYEDSGHDFRAVTRVNQNNPSEQWHLTATAENTYRISQVGHNDGSLWSSPRYLDAYEGAAGPAHNWLGVTRARQNNPSQEWVVTPLLPGEEATAQQLVATMTQLRPVQNTMFLSMVAVAGISMLALVVGMTRRRNQLPDGEYGLLDSEHKTETETA